MPTSAAIRASQHAPIPPNEVTWAEIMNAIPEAVSDIEVRMINGTAKDALDYEKHAGTGLKVIAIGGDNLARGLSSYLSEETIWL